MFHNLIITLTKKTKSWLQFSYIGTYFQETGLCLDIFNLGDYCFLMTSTSSIQPVLLSFILLTCKLLSLNYIAACL